MEWNVVPIERWPGEQTRERREHRFSKERERRSPYSGHTYKQAYRDAAKRLHPDAPGGSTRDFQLLQEAKSVLEAHHGARA